MKENTYKFEYKKEKEIYFSNNKFDGGFGFKIPKMSLSIPTFGKKKINKDTAADLKDKDVAADLKNKDVAADLNSINLELDTNIFEIKNSKSFKKIKGLYIKDFSGKEKEVSSFIFDKAVKETNSKLGLLYDTRNTRFYCEYYVEKIPIRHDNIRWSRELEFEFEQNKYRTYLVTNPRMYNDLQNFLENLIKTNKQWYIIPTGIPGHSVSIYLYKTSENKYDVYFCDPNGEIPNEIHNNLHFHVKSVVNILQEICQKLKKKFTFKGELLKNLQPQGGSVLMYIDTNGFCGAFTWLIIFIIVINQGNLTPEELYEYIQHRVNQWRNKYDESLNQKQKIKNNLKTLSSLNYVKNKKINLSFFKRRINKNNIYLESEREISNLDPNRNLKDTNEIFFTKLLEQIYPEDFLEKIDLKQMKIEYEQFIKQIMKQLSQQEKIKLRNNPEIIQELNWFEMSILSFLLYIKEFYEEKITEYPLLFFKDKNELEKMNEERKKFKSYNVPQMNQ